MREELGVGTRSLRRLGEFSESAADLVDVTVTVVVYAGDLEGEPRPANEIEEMRWVSAREDLPLAPSLSRHIVPLLVREGLFPDA